MHQRLAVFPLRSPAYLSTQKMHHKLATVTDPQNRDSHFEQRRIHTGGIVKVYAVGPARQNDSHRSGLLNGLQPIPIRNNLTIHIAFADPAGNQLIILTSKIDHKNFFIFYHRTFSHPLLVDLLHCNGLCQISGLIDIASLHGRNIICEKLERHNRQ